MKVIEDNVGRKADINSVNLQKGDVPVPFANTAKARCLLGYKPKVSIEDGIRKFVKWFKEEDATSQYRMDNQPFEACFVTSVYASDVEAADRPADIKAIRDANPTFRYFVFTNLEDLVAPGWTKVVKRFPEYHHFLTHSRWGEFLGWKDPHLQECQAIIYLDGYIQPEPNAEVWRSALSKVRNSEFGLMQELHAHKGPEHEFEFILKGRKDMKTNFDASIHWLKAQPDYSPTSTVYINTSFVCDPTNRHYQEASQLFWKRYSLEEDSWRDQPLWSYILHKLKMQPLPFPMATPKCIKKFSKRMGHKKHRYSAAQDNDAPNAG